MGVSSETRSKTFSLAILITLAVVVTFTGCSKPLEVTCNTPYIKVGTECCLDQNSNSVCDKDEPHSLTVAAAEAKPNATAPAAVCNKPYIMVGTQCCLDKNDNAICDSDETGDDTAKGEQAARRENATIAEMRDTLVTINVHTKTTEENIRDVHEPIITEIDILGSGFIVNEKGEILTNAHLVLDYVIYCTIPSFAPCKLKATTLEGEKYDLDWVALSPEWDFATLKIKNVSSIRKFKYAKMARESGKIGDVIYVLGAPRGLEFSITKGIISQKDRDSLDYPEDKRYSKYMQVDAAVNEGNSGGPIINEQGEVVGMASFGYLDSEGLNFGLQSEILIDLYSKVFNETPVILRKTDYMRLHGSDSFTKEVRVSEPSNTALITSGKEVRFDGVSIGISNKKNSTIKLCFIDRLITFYGIISYNRESDQTEEMKPQSSKQIDHYPKITIDSDYTHFYLVDIFDCDTRQAYGRVYGPGTYRD